ncbi:6847_t:CDS:2 [Racocetra persica]|uniref:6847_t:CDS:1 n=1 Tax=Racocetra persica TaxID=160502 RepID=A0ACA9KM00_9GLOM|nr:6847_t:CDS:2 [Racocetra persica]
MRQPNQITNIANPKVTNIANPEVTNIANPEITDITNAEVTNIANAEVTNITNSVVTNITNAERNQDQDCTRCRKNKPITKFTRMRRNENESIYMDVDDNESNNDKLLYDFCDFEELVIAKFRDSEENNEQINFSIIVKIEELVNKDMFNDDLSSELDQNENAKFHNILEASSSQSNNISISEHYAIVKSKKAKLVSDAKIFETLVKIINENIENDKLYEAYKALKQPLVAETNVYTESLNSKK